MSRVPDVNKDNFYALLANYVNNVAYMSLYDVAVTALKQNTQIYTCYVSTFRTYVTKLKTDKNALEVVLNHITSNFNKYFVKNCTTNDFVTILHRTVTGDAAADLETRKKALHIYLSEVIERVFEYVVRDIGERIVLERTDNSLYMKMDGDIKEIVRGLEHVMLTGDNPNKTNKTIDEVHLRYRRIITELTDKYNKLVQEFKVNKQSYDDIIRLISAAGITGKILQDVANKQATIVVNPVRTQFQSPQQPQQSLQQQSQQLQQLQQPQQLQQQIQQFQSPQFQQPQQFQQSQQLQQPQQPQQPQQFSEPDISFAESPIDFTSDL